MYGICQATLHVCRDWGKKCSRRLLAHFVKSETQDPTLVVGSLLTLALCNCTKLCSTSAKPREVRRLRASISMPGTDWCRDRSLYFCCGMVLQYWFRCMLYGNLTHSYLFKGHWKCSHDARKSCQFPPKIAERRVDNQWVALALRLSAWFPSTYTRIAVCSENIRNGPATSCSRACCSRSVIT